MRKDVFVELDWMEGFRPDIGALLDVVMAFDEAPVGLIPAPETGIGLHYVLDQDEPIDYESAPDDFRRFATDTARHYFATDEARWRSFSYAIAVDHLKSRDRYVQGLAYLPGPALWDSDDDGEADFEVSNIHAVAVGDILADHTDPHKVRADLAQSFMHELGHNLGLCHKGPVAVDAVKTECKEGIGSLGRYNNKPNYLSVMNYAFPLGLIRDDGPVQWLGGIWGFPFVESVRAGIVDFSGVTLSPLDEGHLNETVGIGDDGFFNDRGYGTVWKCGWVKARVSATAPLNWNCLWGIEPDVSADINGDGITGLLHAENDWANLIFGCPSGRIGTLDRTGCSSCRVARVAGPKIAIVGAGGVGTTTAYAALISGVAHQIALYDRTAAKAEAEALDLEHGLLFVPSASIVGSDDISVCSGADVIVVTAGAKQSPGESRLDLAGRNAELFRDLIPQLAEGSPEAVLMIIANPVDVLTYAAWKLSEFPSSRVFGSGTLLDTSRLRFLLAQRCGVAETNVHVTIAGEHGDSAFVLWSSALIGNVPLEHWRFEGGEGLSAGELDELTDQVKHAAQEIIRGKGATTFAIGLAATSILEAVVGDAHRAIPVSSLQRGLHGVSDVCLSLPVVVGSPGIEREFEIPMTDAERQLLQLSADVIGGTIRSIGF